MVLGQDDASCPLGKRTQRRSLVVMVIDFTITTLLVLMTFRPRCGIVD
jgi:hypothetical protein